MSIVLALETSCDETACAVVEDLQVLSSVVDSQIAVHAPFGGVVPELASRGHLDAIVEVVRRALADARVDDLGRVDAIAVTEGPGLVGALLVGAQFARGLAAAHGLPLIGVHHMEGHIFSAFLGDDRRASEPFAAHLALLVSGGHTELVHVEALGRYAVLGSTRDDAVGEAYDKVAKVLGLGYPGGPVIDRLAAQGRGDALELPRSMIHHPGFDFSFAGLKTAVMVHIERHGQPRSREELVDLCASFQAAAVDVLVARTIAAQRSIGCDRVHVVGGVAANQGLARAMREAGERQGFRVVVPPLRYCGDNAAMIAAAGAARYACQGTGRTIPREPVEVRATFALDDDRVRIG